MMVLLLLEADQVVVGAWPTVGPTEPIIQVEEPAVAVEESSFCEPFATSLYQER